MPALRELAFDMVVEIAADGIRENQAVINFLRHIFVNHDCAAIAEPRRQHMGAFVIGNGFYG